MANKNNKKKMSSLARRRLSKKAAKISYRKNIQKRIANGEVSSTKRNEDPWLSCQTDVNKLVQPYESDEDYFPENSIDERKKKEDNSNDEPNEIINEIFIDDAYINKIKEEEIKLFEPNEITDEIFNYEHIDGRVIDERVIDGRVIDEHVIDEHVIDEYVIDGHVIDERVIDGHVIDEHINKTDDEENKPVKIDEEWVIERTLCRCCHAEGSFTSLETIHNDATYNEMLAECFSIQLFPVTAAARAALGAACALCMARLRDALAFSRQVRACEARFQELYLNNCIKVVEMELKIEIELDLHEPKFDADVAMNIDLDLSDASIVKEKAKPKKLTKTWKKYKRKVKRIKLNENVTPEELLERDKVKAKPKKLTKTKKKCTRKEEPIELNENVTPEELLERALQYGQSTIPYELVLKRIGDKYKCTQCDLISLNRRAVRNHFRRIHLHIFYKCKNCTKAFGTRSALSKHMLDEHGIDTRLKCNACDNTFLTKNHLIKHNDNYHMLGEKLKCAECDYVCYSKCSLRKHQEKHSKVMKFHCGYCKKSFLRKKTLQTHERIHTGDKRKSCKECGQAFVQKASLNYHMAKHHPGVKF